MFINVNTLINEKSKDLKLTTLVSGTDCFYKKITTSCINKPGLALAGFFKHFPYERIQIIGKSEYSYLNSLSYNAQINVLFKIFSHKNSVCCILTNGLKANKAMLKIFFDLHVPLLKTEFKTSSFINDLICYLDAKLAQSIKIHGVMVSVYGLGVLIIGKSAIGKSECALELLKRGHKFVADDVVIIKKRSEFSLSGSGIEIMNHLIEVRGIGIINVKDIFGIGSILDEIYVELVVKFEMWKSEKEYERLGIDEYCSEFLNVKIPMITIPVGPGRNLAVLVETATLNQRLKNNGCFVAKKFDYKLKKANNGIVL